MNNNFSLDKGLLQDLNKSIQDFTNQHNKELKQMFGKFIKPSLMIRIKEEIKCSPEFIDILNLCQFYGRTVHALGMDDVDFDICVNLAMINWYLLLPIDDNDKHSFYSNPTYIQNIKERTIKQCKLRPLIQNYEERNFILAHTPLHYSLHCMVNFLLSRIDDNLKKGNRSTVPNANFRINSLIVMLKNIRSILLLTEIDNCGSAFSLLRALIESLFIYLAIYNNEVVANEYYKFMDFRISYEEAGQYPQEFLELLPKYAQKQNYLNYGWLDSIENKKRKYTFNEILEYSAKTDKDYNESYLMAYKFCCKFAHGNYVISSSLNY